jgi:hypothetical protein
VNLFLKTLKFPHKTYISHVAHFANIGLATLRVLGTHPQSTKTKQILFLDIKHAIFNHDHHRLFNIIYNTIFSLLVSLKFVYFEVGMIFKIAFVTIQYHACD